MKNLNKLQLMGILISGIGLTISFLFESSAIQFFAGITCAVGISYILKFIPFYTKDLNLKPRKIFNEKSD